MNPLILSLLSSLATIIGTFLMGFILIPNIGVSNINIGITAVNGTIIQAYTNEQALLDGPKINVSLENCRAAAENITPKTISKAALNRVIPELNGKILTYNAFRVPVAQGAAFNLVIKVDNPCLKSKKKVLSNIALAIKY